MSTLHRRDGLGWVHIRRTMGLVLLCWVAKTDPLWSSVNLAMSAAAAAGRVVMVMTIMNDNCLSVCPSGSSACQVDATRVTVRPDLHH